MWLPNRRWDLCLNYYQYYFLFVFSVVSKKIELSNISKRMQLLWKSLRLSKNRIQEENKFFDQYLLYFIVFQKINYQVFWSSFGICPLQIAWLVALWSNEDIYLEILPILHQIFASLSKTAIAILKQNKKFDQIFFYLPFGCPQANFVPLKSRQRYSMLIITLSRTTWKRLGTS